MSFIMTYKWYILVCLEVVAWFFTFFMFYARYGMKSNFWFKFAAFFFAITGVIPQVIIGIINFISERKVDLFTLVIVVLIIYGATIGKKNVKQLDNWAKRKFGGSQSDQ
ncbi:hypothetical protein ACFO4N_04010 [Camelliibacillus cellulosilyticus]|uniref:Uncharacterized protein n=1 Tax=Camelliibacillus cellulosilyticus TaxID=2174486 RepID=A0ABV9GL50_9BACL